MRRAEHHCERQSEEGCSSRSILPGHFTSFSNLSPLNIHWNQLGLPASLTFQVLLLDCGVVSRHTLHGGWFSIIITINLWGVMEGKHVLQYFISTLDQLRRSCHDIQTTCVLRRIACQIYLGFEWNAWQNNQSCNVTFSSPRFEPMEDTRCGAWRCC